MQFLENFSSDQALPRVKSLPMTTIVTNAWPDLKPKDYRETLNAAPVMMRRLTATQHCEWTNTFWLTFCGRTVEQERDLGWTANVHPEDVSVVIAKLLSACSSTVSVHLQYRLRRADGQYTWVEERGGGLWKARGFYGHILVCQELSEQMQEVQSLRLATERARHDAFAHRVKNTLQIIMSTLQLEARDADVGGPQLRHAARRVQAIITVQDRADMYERDGQVDLNRLLLEVTRAVIGTQTALKLEYEASSLPVVVTTARATTLALIVAEAMINTIKSAGDDRATLVRIVLECQQGELSIEVSDDGPGFSQRVLGIDSDSASLESLLFRSMAAQARAQLTLLNRGGAVLRLRAPLE